MNWTNYWVIYDTKTFLIKKRYFLEDDAEKRLRKYYRDFKYMWNVEEKFKLDLIYNITEKQWRAWKLLQK